MKLLKSITLATALWMSSCVAPQIPINQSSQLQLTEIRVADDERPSYLRTLPPAEEISGMSPVERIVEQYVQETLDLRNPMPRIFFSNGSPKRLITVNGESVMVELPFYRHSSNNTLRNIIEDSTDNEETVFRDFNVMLTRSNDIVMEHFNRIDNNANERVRRRTGSVYNENSTIEGLDGITLGHALGMQHHTNRNLVPRRLIFTPIRSAYATTRLHENIISYSPIARRTDEISGNPGILSHELWHLSQSLPDAVSTNIELLAYSMNLDLNRHDSIWFLAHPYGDTVRELSKIYFGLDSENILDQLIRNRMGAVVELDEQVLNANYQQMTRLSERFADELHNEVEPEYRSFSPYWGMIQNYYKDGDLQLRLTIAKHNEPTSMTAAERRIFMVAHGRDINRILSEAKTDYKMPRIIQFGPFRMMQGTTIDELIEQKCAAAGFSEEQTEYVFHLFLRRNFFNRDGTYNYGNISLENSLHSMEDLISEFNEITDEQLNRYFPNTATEVKNQINLYKWYLQRLKNASLYQSFAVREGLSTNPNFVPVIFDPRVNLLRHYGVLPSYTENTSNMSLRSQSRKRIGDETYVIHRYDLSRDVGYENGIDYISVFRINNDGRRESKPCLLIYAANGSRRPNFALFDSESEGKEGHGSYDRIKQLTGTPSIDDLLMELNNTVPTQQQIPVPLMPQSGRFQPPEGYRAWEHYIREQDSDSDNKIDSIGINYRNGDRTVREIYSLPEGYDGAIVLEDRILLSQRGVFDVMDFESLRNPYAVQLLENGSMTTLFEPDGNGNYLRRLR